MTKKGRCIIFTLAIIPKRFEDKKYTAHTFAKLTCSGLSGLSSKAWIFQFSCHQNSHLGWISVLRDQWRQNIRFPKHVNQTTAIQGASREACSVYFDTDCIDHKLYLFQVFNCAIMYRNCAVLFISPTNLRTKPLRLNIKLVREYVGEKSGSIIFS